MSLFASVGPQDGFEHWHEVTCRHYSHTECRRIPSGRFSATVSTQTFGNTLFSHISSRVGQGQELALKRENAHIRKDDRDAFFLWVGREGHTSFEQNGWMTRLEPGDIMLMDQTQPFDLMFGETSATTLVIVERAQLLSRLPWIERAAGKKVSRNQPWSRLFSSVVDGLLASGPLDAPDAVEEMALDMWSGVLRAGLDEAPEQSSKYAQKLQQATAYMRRHLDNPELNTETIAKAVNVSSRSLLRMFAETGSTPMRWLMQARLEASREALEQARFSRVTDVAFALGFRNLSHFSRTFKAHYGVSPQSLLRS